MSYSHRHPKSNLCACGCGELCRNKWVHGHNRMVPPEQRVWQYVEKTDTCWLWTGTLNDHGYGTLQTMRLSTDGRRYPNKAHRFVYELLKGPIPEGMELDHKCRIPRCVRPEHLEPVTHKVNMERGIIATRPVCKRGHLYGDNPPIDRDGFRHCIECHELDKERRRKSYATKRQVGMTI
jgi:hypothetical protein